MNNGFCSVCGTFFDIDIHGEDLDGFLTVIFCPPCLKRVKENVAYVDSTEEE